MIRARMQEWRDVPLAALLEKLLARPVCLCNDADAALLAECWVGAAARSLEADDCLSVNRVPRPGRADVAHVVMVTLGSGVGVAVRSGGVLLRGSRGLIEGGHSIIQLPSNFCGQRLLCHPGSLPASVAKQDAAKSNVAETCVEPRACGCGQRGCVEAYVSANSVKKRFCEKLTSIRDQNAEAATGQDTGAEFEMPTSTQDIFALASTGGPSLELPAGRHAEAAKQVVAETAAILGAFCVNLCRAYDPELIIFG